MAFEGTAKPLSASHLDSLVNELDVDAAAIWSVITVETSGSGFLADRRPKILFERHWFHRLTDGQFDDQAPDLSQSSAGGYGSDGANQYERLERAIQLDEFAALKSTSWGLGQIMGFNAEKSGYPGVQEMVDAFCASEDEQLGAVAAFIKTSGIDKAMRDQDWVRFARAYNGPDFQVNNYDKKLDAAYTRFKTGPMPDLTVRAVQMALTFLQIPNVGGIDGWFGAKTQQALIRFQTDAELTVTGQANDETVAELAKRLGW